ncbi:hypothetical protein [Amycolatopsis sp. WGS_07]|uniref:hypothetical protein n=1 Tax=Amycolatopsis sp. WGS_07 TaxID=3076764 RepID=UPI0038732D9D
MNDNEHPSPGEPAGQEPTEQFGRTGDLGAASSGGESAGQPDASAKRPGAAAEQPAHPSQPASAAEAGKPNQPSEAPPAAAAEQTAQQPAQPGPFAQPSPWGMPLPPRKQGGFRRFLGHRATQLVAVGVLGLAVGGGIVGGVMAATNHHSGRPGMSQHQGGHRFNDGGPGQHHRIPDGQDNDGPRFGN